MKPHAPAVVAAIDPGRPWPGRGRRCALVAVLLALGSMARAEERFPPPDFTNHRLPQTVVPAAASLAWEYLDLAALAAALAAASYLALVRRSRKGLFVLSIASLAWLGFWRGGCVCPIGSIQNVALAAFQPGYAIPLAVVAIFLLPLLFTLFFGRTFCAAVCPLGAAQELVAFRPVRVPAWLEHSLGLLPYVYLGAGVLFAATGTAFVICWYDPFVGFFRLGASTAMLLFGAAMLALGTVVGRPYCRFLCPYGALLRLVSKAARRHVRIPPDECINCRLCEDVCPYGAILPPSAPLTADRRRRLRAGLIVALVALPLLVAIGWLLGGKLGQPLSRMDVTVRLAEQVRLEETGAATEPTDASDAFRNTGRPKEELYRDAQRRVKRLGWLGAWLGAWVGLVVGVKLVHLSIRRRRNEYEPDRAGCVSCGRCFWYCPKEQLRLGLIDDLTHLEAKTDDRPAAAPLQTQTF